MDKGIFGTEMHVVTFLICLIEVVFFFYQIIYYLSRPQDKNRLYYLILLYLLIQYNVVAGLLPDKRISINQMVQNILMFTCGTAMTMYFPIYFYKAYDLKKMKFYAYWGSMIFLLAPFLLLFVVPYIVTDDIELCRKLFVVIPFLYGLSFFYVLKKSFSERNRASDDLIQLEEIRWMFIAVLCWSTLAIVALLKMQIDKLFRPIFKFDNSSQIVEVISINFGMLIMTALFLKRTIKQSRQEYLQLQELNNGLQEKVIERTLAIERMNKQKENAFLNLIHETKTPITLIDNYISEYIEQNGNSAELEIVKRNINKLSKDINNLFDLERLNKGLDTDSHYRPIDLSLLLQESLQLFDSYCSRKNIRLERDTTKEVYVYANEESITRIINNLMENAIRYSNTDTCINVSLTADEDQVWLRFADEGCGIEGSQLENIFTPYVQINNNKNNVQGMGLGLPLVKKIVTSLKGSISISSSITPGQSGTTLSISLPRCFEVPEATFTIPHYKDTMQEAEAELADFHKPDIQITILVVEDNVDQNTYLSKKLSQHYNVLTALNGEQALEKMKATIPDLIISDIMMDEMDGFQLAEVLSGNIQYQHIPIIFLSARNGAPDKLKGLGTGAIDYIEKPFSIEQVRLKINSILKQKERLEQKLFQDVYKAVKQHRIVEKNVATTLSPKVIIEQNIKSYTLTKREKEIAKQLMEGLSPKTIGEKSFISEKTVNTHIRNIYEKLGVNSRFEMIKKLQAPAEED